MEDYIIDANGNRRDKRTGQLIGENKVETITNPQPYSPGRMATEEEYKKQSGWEKAKDWLQKHYSEENGKPIRDFGIESAREAKKDGALTNTINDTLNKATEGIGNIADTPENNQMGGTESFGKLTDKIEEQPEEQPKEEQPKETIKTETSDVEKLGSNTEMVDSREVKDILSKLNEDKLPKNGADYLKRLWSQGAGGKAAAVGNVLGNLLGGLKWEGKGGEGGDWKKYQEDYLKNQAELEKQRDSQALNVVNQAAMNAQARQDLVAKMNLALQQGGKMTPEAMRLLTIFSAAENPGADIKTGIATLLSSLNL